MHRKCRKPNGNIRSPPKKQPKNHGICTDTPSARLPSKADPRPRARAGGCSPDDAPVCGQNYAWTQGEVGVQITDAGAGIPHRDMAKCFHFFYTTVPYKEPTYADGSNFGGELEGRGVGLPLCKAYAGVYRGNVSMASAAGCGTTVCLSLRDDAVL